MFIRYLATLSLSFYLGVENGYVSTADGTAGLKNSSYDMKTRFAFDAFNRARVRNYKLTCSRNITASRRAV